MKRKKRIVGKLFRAWPLAALLACVLLPAAPSWAGVLSGKKILLVVAPTNFQDVEYKTCRDTFVKDGAEVAVASVTLDPARGMSGAVVQPDETLRSVDPGPFDAVVFIGGPGATALWDNGDARRVVHDAMEEGKVLGAICLAPVILARAGALRGHPCTVWPDASREMTEAGCLYQKDDVVRSGNIVTANGPEAAEKFARTVEMALIK